MSSTRVVKKKGFTFSRLHKYYQLTGFYNFVIDSIKKSMPPVLIVVGLLAIMHFFFLDIFKALELAVEYLPSYGVLAFFYVSETVLGIIPPELFIGWAWKTDAPLVYLSIIAVLSYLGGITAYFIGQYTLRIPSFHDYLEVKMAKQLTLARKWGGVLIAVGALLPLPFSMSCLVAGMLRYPINSVMIIGLLRFLRFAVYGAAVFQML
jgi:membrane protein YqaA with SNARE-associated domain